MSGFAEPACPQGVDCGVERPLFVVLLSAYSVEKLEIPKTTNFALVRLQAEMPPISRLWACQETVRGDANCSLCPSQVDAGLVPPRG